MVGIEACLDPGTGVSTDELFTTDGPHDVDAFWADFDEGLAIERAGPWDDWTWDAMMEECRIAPSPEWRVELARFLESAAYQQGGPLLQAWVERAGSRLEELVEQFANVPLDQLHDAT